MFADFSSGLLPSLCIISCRYIWYWYLHLVLLLLFFFLLVLNSKCNAVTRASKSRGRLESRHHLLQKLRAIGETGSLNSYLCLCPLSALCNQINLNKTGGKLMHWSSAQSIVWFTHYCTAAEGHISSHCSEPNWELKPFRTKKYSTWKNAIFQIVFSSFKLFNMVTQTLGKKWNCITITQRI